MPRALHGDLARAAEREGTSLNRFIIDTLASAVGSRPTGANGAGETDAEPGAQPTGARDSAPKEERRFRLGSNALLLVLAINFVVVVLAGAVALGLLIFAWQS